MKTLRCAAKLLLMAVTTVALSGSAARSAEHHVSVQLDANSDFSAAFSDALLRARQHRSNHPDDTIIVDMPPGVFRLQNSISLDNRDSGKDDAPLIIRGAERPATTTLRGSIVVSDEKLPQADTLEYFSDQIQTQVRQISTDLPGIDIGITPRGMLHVGASSRIDLYRNGKRLRLARWPKKGFSRDILGFRRANSSSRDFRIKLSNELFDHIKREPEAWIGGFWSADYKYETSAIKLASEQLGELALAVEVSSKKSDAFRYFLFNIYSELNDTESYAIDSRNKRLFLLNGRSSDVFELAVAKGLLKIEDARNIRVERLALEQTLSNTVEVLNSTNITLEDCFVGHSGSTGIVVKDGGDVSIKRCLVTDSSEIGVSLIGGDLADLRRANHQIDNSLIANFGVDSLSYRPGVQVRGVGNIVQNSIISNGPHSAISLQGIEHKLLGNHIRNVVRATDDAGAIYMGRNWANRGNLIEGNYLHDIGDPNVAQRLAAGIYLDDQFSGVTIRGNLFSRCSIPVLIGGGRDNLVQGNKFFLDGNVAIRIDDRGATWQGPSSEAGRSLISSYEEALSHPKIRETYPEIQRAADPPWLPRGNVFEANVAFGGQLLFGSSAAALASSVVKENEELVTNTSSSHDLGEILQMVRTVDSKFVALKPEGEILNRLHYKAVAE
ncbi:right-handed parallel beta-helix repeat-containing protein [Bradyrhizobium yuanmingense]|uniref:right-handed parallel beta-helix repeat-containing protein n=1 Tax=Bradyrhizobium TaxID=374 RepID=UPI001CD21B2F|nr:MULTISPECIES: right-handed parallel beta-helix repeat-containing protein [unclassified Bradyrhizobium]MCA1512319.1 right-handed parallel beta-helix repeat-containing protein [Bradyrhizobium sp. NBAIM01]UWU85788.1 right-handed parallel beta-helix repeat-containing protein [Bradyrhizobium sp. CB1024]